MPLAFQPVDVPLTVVDQISPTTSGPIGRLKRLVNAQVTRFQSARLGDTPSCVRVEKREAFVTLPDAVRDSATGALITSALLDNQTLLTEFEGRALLLSNDQAHVLSTKADAWMRHDYQLPAYALSEKFIHTSNSLATTPDVAHANGVYCYTWVVASGFNAGGGTPKELPGCYFRVEDASGVVLRADTRINATDTRVKCVTDGTYFWVFSEKGDGTGNIGVNVLDANGVVVAGAAWAATYTSGDYWDVTPSPFGPLFAQGTGTGVEFSKFAFNGVSITRTAHVDTGIAGTGKLGFLTNDTPDAYAYLATVDPSPSFPNYIRAYRIPSTLTNDHAYTVATSVPDEVANITGYVLSGSDIVVAWSYVDATGAQYLANRVQSNRVTFGGAVSNLQSVYSMNLASRAFKLGARYYAVGYYPSNLANVSATVRLPNQPTFFLIPLDSTSQRVAGRFEYAAAYADWQTPSSKYNFALSTLSNDRVALSYRAESFTSSTWQVNGDISYRVQTQATTVGVKAYVFGDPGEAVTYANEIVLPGAGAASWSGGEFSESGFNLALEQPAVSMLSSGGGHGALTPGTYQWVAVLEWTDTNGRRVRSRPSPPVTGTVGASQYASITGWMSHVTNKRDALISIYRTDMVPDSGGGYVPTTLHYKVTVDATVTGGDAPLYNDNTQQVWGFSDSNTGITANEILYTDKGQLENFPAPPFARGCVWRERVCVVAPDNSIWLSSAPTEGDALWWHPAIRLTLPTADPIKSIRASTEGYLLALCESSMWYFPETTLPDSSGQNGSLPSAVELHFNMGCTGQALATKLGVVFSSSAGGVWLIPRDLSAPVWLSEAMADTLSDVVTSLAIDARQRIYAATFGNTLGVYDTIAGCWYEWEAPANVQRMASLGGALAFSDGGTCWQQAADTYVDALTVAGVTTQLPYYLSLALNFLHLGGVKNYKRIWEAIFTGQVSSICDVLVEVAYDDDFTVVESKTFTTSGAQLLARLAPKKQLCSSITFTLTEALNNGQVSGKGFALEMISLGLGLEPKGLARLPLNRRF